jgi:hypothetical protein
MPATNAKSTDKSPISKSTDKSPRSKTRTRKSSVLTNEDGSLELEAPRQSRVWRVSRGRKTKPSVPEADIPRIKTWLKFGQKMSQAAAMYRLPENEMRDLVRGKAAR